MISVIIPMYNSQDTIVKALDSVKNQTAFDEVLEIIVINDGSKDQSLKVVEKYCSENSFLPIKIINKENGGVSTARNAGLKMARGEYIAFLDSDDEWLPEKIKVQLEILRNNKEMGLLATTFNNEKRSRFLYKKFDYLTEISTTDLIFKNYFQPSTVILRKTLLDEIGLFPEDQKYAEDANFFFRATNSSRCFLLNESYLNFGNGKQAFGASGLSSNLVEMQKGEVRNLKFAKREKYINTSLYSLALIFSYIKYIRRIMIVKLKPSDTKG